MKKKKSSNISVIIGAAFLMATSAIGLGFQTQITVFTMVLIAALLVPGHHYLEKWIWKKMVGKNRKIKIAAANRNKIRQY